MPNRRGFFRLNLHFLFFLSGIVTVLIGQVLPIFARQFSLSDLQVSWFFPSQFAGSLVGTFFTSRFARRNDYRMATIVGGFAMIAGVLLMNFGAFPIVITGFFINGIGIGMTLPSINMIVLEMSPERTASSLSILNFCWGVGAIVCKPFVDLWSTTDGIGLTTILLAIPMAISTVLLLLDRSYKPLLPELSDPETSGPSIAIWRQPIAWLIALFNLIHVGFESGMGGWLTTYTGRLDGGPIFPLASPTLLYFVFFVAGRGVAPILFRFLSEGKMLMFGLQTILAGMVVVIVADSVLVLSFGSVIAGFGTSWVFPTNVSRFSNEFGPEANRRSAPFFIAGTLGAAISTWLIGFISEISGNLRSGMYVLLISVTLLIVLQIGLGLRARSVVKIERA
ncbi:MAG TPA: MFS transporter [Pyrinomonadaceae bacterium]|nr:MFS transporter [Pyrinomonadaceae bacterium]